MWHWNVPTNDGKSYTCTPGKGSEQTSFDVRKIFEPQSDEYKLMMKIESDLQKMIQFAESKNKQLQGTAENRRLSILGKDSKVKDDKPLEVVNAYVKENTTEVVDPLDAQKKADALKEKRDTLLTELDTQIKVSNATTFVEI